MNFFDAVEARRSVRRYDSTPVPECVVKRALHAAILAPNSSNAQTWDFYWVRSSEKKRLLVEACLNQSAARTAQELAVIVASPNAWRRSHKELANFAMKINAPASVQMYYEKLFPYMYRSGPLNIFGFLKMVTAFFIGLFRPIMRGPFSLRATQEVAVKSAALAAENFVLAITAQGFSTCMMEGFDEWRVKKLLNLECSSRVVMVISVGREAERGTWGPRFRLQEDKVIHEV